MKPILKNTEKYNNIKLAKGILLDNVKTVARGGKSGISTKTFSKKWFCLPQGKALFKSFDGVYYFDIKNNRIINELLCQELCHQVGIDCPKMEPATIEDITGLISYNVAKPNEQLINAIDLANLIKMNFFSNSLHDYAFACDELPFQGYIADKKKFVEDIYKICIFDLFTMQTDRHEQNIFFLKNKNTKEIKVAPLIDNEFAFCGKKLISYMSKGIIDIDEDIIKQYGNFANHIDIKEFTKPSFENYATEIVTLAKYDNNFRTILKQFVEKIDIKSAIENVKKYGYEIPQEYEDYVTNLTNFVKEYVVEKYKEMKINKKELQEDFEILY